MKSIILILCVGAVLINCTSDTGQRPANVKPWKKFHTAARLGDLPKIKELLRMGTDVNILDTGERTPLFTAAANGHDAVVLLLLKNGADVNLKQKYGRAPIFDASYN
ncbi:potassium channel GORK-like, partial [Contarinia nasturtii]|uniref:potassium channel GORK-like n=1 Tax=Contarinia nasturtii TaxID=265458 RepID=UPI0012D3E2A4